VLSLTSKVSQAKGWSTLQKQVWQTVEAYAQASHERDLKKYLSFWHRDFLGWHNGDSMPTTYEQRQKGLKHYFSRTKSLEYSLEPIRIQIVADGKAAIVHYKIDYSICVPSLCVVSTRWPRPEQCYMRIC